MTGVDSDQCDVTPGNPTHRQNGGQRLLQVSALWYNTVRLQTVLVVVTLTRG